MEIQEKYRSYDVLSAQLHSLVDKVETLKINQIGIIQANGSDYPFWMVTSTRHAAKKKVCLSAGIHGDEPAGVEAILGLITALASQQALLERFHFTFFPCMNPHGYEFNTRENGLKMDLNRQFDKESPPDEVRLFKQAITGLRFDFTYECHEDIDSPGYYLYEMSQKNQEAIGTKIIHRVQEICPINNAENIEDMPARSGLIHASYIPSDFFWERIKRRGGWPQTVYMYEDGSKICITAETPTRLEMEVRVKAHLMAIETALALV